MFSITIASKQKGAKQYYKDNMFLLTCIGLFFISSVYGKNIHQKYIIFKLL